jgi:hypothetical protein
MEARAKEDLAGDVVKRVVAETGVRAHAAELAVVPPGPSQRHA